MMINTIVIMTKVCLLNMMFFKIVESTIPNFYVMEWCLDCPLCLKMQVFHLLGLALLPKTTMVDDL